MKILVLNSGSSSLKYQLIDSETENILAKGLAERIGLADGGGKIKYESVANGKGEMDVEMSDHEAAVDHVFTILTDPKKGAIKSVDEISVVGHRVLHGGEKFKEPALVNEEVMAEIDRMSVLGPLHNPANLKGIKACIRLMPNVPQVAVFDTAFHATMPDYAYMYALPYKYYTDLSIRRYGFHGTSHKYVTAQAQKLLAKQGFDTAKTRIITCHLGNGSSMAAVVGGKVVDTSMGLTPCEGMVMGTRCGDLDPAILPYIAKELNATPQDLDNIINKKSGLLGISGISSDMRDVEEAAAKGNKRAGLALSMFCYRIKKYIGAYIAAMGGLDAIIFTGGIGENGIPIRERICSGLEVFGIEIDHEKNNVRGKIADLAKDTSKVKIMLIPTNEERMIARETVQVAFGG